jgi:diguanylate cyclase (GGDEF)-like protein/PAS domain S-box-containing protein
MRDDLTARRATLSNPITAECVLLFEHLRDVVLFIRASDGTVRSVNRAAEKTYGWSRAELEKMRIYDLVVMPEDAPFPPADATRDSQITEEGVLFESVHRRRDGSTFPVEVSARLAVLDDQTTVIAVVRDITERIEAQHALRRAYDEIEQVFDTAADGMRIVDRDFNVLRSNSTLAEMSGLDRDTVIGQKCYETFKGVHCHTDHCPQRQILAGAGSLVTEIDKVNSSGESISCILHAQPFLVDGEVVGIVEAFRDITDRKQAEELARHMATHDALTALPNRLLLTDRLEMELARARREDTRPALMFCDVDRFKGINDRRGHAVGDEVLRSIAISMSSAVREIDTVARMGGDEFVVLLSDVRTPADAEAVARKVLDVVHALSIVEESPLGVSLSVGIALFREDDDMDSLMNRADAAMYEVKDRGGDDFLIAVNA